MSDVLKFDFNKANLHIQELEEIKAEIEKLANSEYAETMQQLSAAWKGESADAYMRKAGKLQDKINKTAKDIGKVADAYKEAARRAKKAEELAETIAIRRK